MKRKGKEVVFAEVRPELKKSLRLAAKLEDCDMADITRAAIREKIALLAEKHPQLARQLASANA